MNNSEKSICYGCVNRKLDNLRLLCKTMYESVSKINYTVYIERKKLQEVLEKCNEEIGVDTPRDRSRSTTPVKKKQRKKKASPKEPLAPLLKPKMVSKFSSKKKIKPRRKKKTSQPQPLSPKFKVSEEVIISSSSLSPKIRKAISFSRKIPKTHKF